MFESLVLTVLERVLGQCARGYFQRTRSMRGLTRSVRATDVEGLDRASLKVAVWSGNVTVRTSAGAPPRAR